MKRNLFFLVLLLVVQVWAAVPSTSNVAPVDAPERPPLRRALDVMIDCPAGATPEGEPVCDDGYIDSHNGGCNFSPEVYLPISLGEYFCAESGIYGGGTRDTDWWEYTVTTRRWITWEGMADFDLQLLLLDTNCGSVHVFDEAHPEAGELGVTRVLADPGDYLLWAGPEFYATCDCGSQYWVHFGSPELEITSVTSDLPAPGTPPVDYYANYGQVHTVTVEVTNVGSGPSHEDARIWLYGNADGSTGFTFHSLVGSLEPGEAAYIPFTITEGFMEVTDTITADFGQAVGDPDTIYAYGHSVVDDEILVQIKGPAELVIVDFYPDPASVDNPPFVTQGQEFEMIVEVGNAGGTPAQDLTLYMTTFTELGVVSTFDATTSLPTAVIMPGALETFHIPVTADMEIGNPGPWDERFNIDVTGIDSYDLGPVPVSADIDSYWIGIQSPPELEVVDYFTPNYWLNKNDPFTLQIEVANTDGDFSSAVDLDVLDAFVALHASVVTGIDGMDAPTSVTPNYIDEGSSAIYEFTLQNAGATHNAIVDVEFEAHYRDGNVTDVPEAADSPVYDMGLDIFGIDIFVPTLNMTVPIAGEDFPLDNTLHVTAHDNLSGVQWVRFYIQREIDERFWNKNTGTWQFGFVWYNMTGGPDEWSYTMANHPDPMSVDYRIYYYAKDYAGNVTPLFQTPMGADIPWVHCIDMFSDLHKEIPRSPVDETVTYGYEYEADWGQPHQIRCGIFNPEPDTLVDLIFVLHSRYEDNTVIAVDRDTIPALAPGDLVNITYDVTELYSSVKDSFYIVLVSGRDSDGHPCGFQITDNDIRVKVEKPAVFSMESLYVDVNDAPNTFGPESTFVTKNQQFTMWAKIVHHGEDVIDSVKFELDNQPIGGSGVVSYINTPVRRLYEADWADNDTLWIPFEITADPTDIGHISLVADEEFFLFVDYAKADNWPFPVCSLDHSDTNEFIGVQEPPDLQALMMDVSSIWLNADDPLTVRLRIRNRTESATTPGIDRAVADSIWEYSDLHNTLGIYYNPSYWTKVAGLAGMPVPIASPTEFECEEDSFMVWSIWYDPDPLTPTYQGPVWPQCSVYYHDANYPHQTYPVTAPEFYGAGSLFGIDIEDAVVLTAYVDGPVEPYFAGTPYYREFPEQIAANVVDEISLVNQAQMSIRDHDGNFWDGTDWDSTVEVWLDMTHTALDTWRLDLGDPDDNGIYTVRVRAWDHAGNIPDDPESIYEFWFKYDNICPITNFTMPSADFFSCDMWNPWDRVIQIEAEDVPQAGFDMTSCANVRNTYVGIRDTLQNKWWDGSGWISSATWYWLPCELVDAEAGVWEYYGYTDPGSRVLEVWSWARDSAGGACAPDDTLRYVVIDCQAPDAEVYHPGWCPFTSDMWAMYMYDRLSGVAADSITSIDSVKITVQSDITGDYWDGTDFTSETELWLYPDTWTRTGLWYDYATVPMAPGDMVYGRDMVQWRYDFADPFGVDSNGVFTVCMKTWDHLGHEAEDCASYCIDNNGPEIEPIYPTRNQVIGLTYWIEHDTILANVTEDFGCGCEHVDEVIINISRIREDTGDIQYWFETPFGTGYWVTTGTYGDSIWIPCDNYSGDVWGYYNPYMTMAEGRYQVKMMAWDGVGNWEYDEWPFNILTSAGYLTVEAEDPRIFHVGEEFDIDVTSWINPGHVDSSFYWTVDFGTNGTVAPSDIDLPAPLSLTPDGHEVLQVTAHATGVFNIYVEADPLAEYSRAWSLPITIVDAPGAGIVADIRDVEGDQGDALYIKHTPSHDDQALTTYHYYRDEDMGVGTTLNEIFPVITVFGDPADPDSFYAHFDNLGGWNAYDYAIRVEVEVPAIPGYFEWSDYLGVDGAPMAPVDNIPPATITDLTLAWAGSDVVLTWPEVTLGNEGTPEIDAPRDMTYEVFRSTDPYGEAMTSLVTVTDPTYTDAGAAGDMQNYYYYVKPVDHDNEGAIMAQENWQGKVDMQFDAGWTLGAYPLDGGLATSAEYRTYAGGLDALVEYQPAAGWGLSDPPFAFALDPFTANFGASSPDDEMVTFVGDIPAMGDVWYNLQTGVNTSWNTVTLPLHMTDITTAHELLTEIDGDVDINTVTHLTGGSWEQLLIVGGVPYFNFAVHTGWCYMVWAEDEGVWPDYGVLREAPAVDAELGDQVIVKPCAIYGNFEGDVTVSARFEGTAAIVDARYDRDMFMVQVGDFNESWKAGQFVTITITDNRGTTTDLQVELTGAPAIDLGKVTATGSQIAVVPDEYRLSANTPNPFNAKTQISFDIPEETDVTIGIYDVNGTLVRTLVSGIYNAGRHSVIWDGSDESGITATSGIYLYKLSAGDYSETRRMMLVK